MDKTRQLCRVRKEKTDLADLERYADIITAYRELLRLSALEDDIRPGRGHKAPPHDRDKLIEWVKDPVNLDLTAEAFRRVCSGYVSTGRLFAVQSGPYYMDWPAVLSMLKTAYDVLYGVYVFMEISGRGKLAEEVEELDKILDTIKRIEASPTLSDLIASIPTPEERVILEADR